MQKIKYYNTLINTQLNGNSERQWEYAPGLAFLGTVRQKSFWGLAQVLRQVSTVQINLLLRTRVRRHQFVVTVREINRFYMQCKIMSYSWIMISFLYDKVLVSKSYFDFNISVSWAVIYRVVNITRFFMNEWGFWFSFSISTHSMILLFHNTKTTNQLVMKH